VAAPAPSCRPRGGLYDGVGSQLVGITPFWMVFYFGYKLGRALQVFTKEPQPFVEPLFWHACAVLRTSLGEGEVRPLVPLVVIIEPAHSLGAYFKH
jgi:hypothetical protein